MKKTTYTLEELNKMMERNGGYLDLRGTNITTLPEGLTVGGFLDLRGTNITSLPEGLTVGGSLDLEGTNITNPSAYRHPTHGEYVPGRYLYADGILTHVNRKKKVGGYTYFVGKIPGHNVIYDGENYAHCKNFASGVADLAFKNAKDRGADQYRSLTMDSVVKYEDAVIMYRVITGACAAGTQQFIDGLDEVKDSYTVEEIINMTSGAYGGGVFKAFFEGERK